MKLHFVYGTLMSPEVLTELIGRVPPLVPGTLAGYRRYRVPGQVYPGIVPSAEAQSAVTGLLVKDLKETEVQVFDAFEGDDYVKTPVQVQVAAADARPDLALPAGQHEALVYVWKPVPGQPLVAPWSYEGTFRPHLQDYLETSRAFRDSLDIPRG